MSEPSVPGSLKPARGQFVVQSGPAKKLPSTSSKPLAVFATPSTSKHSKPVSKLASPQSQKFIAVEKPVKPSEYRKRAARPPSSEPLIHDVTMYDAVKRPKDPGLALSPTPSAARPHATVGAPTGYSAYRPRASRPSDAYDAGSQASQRRRSTAGP